MSSPSAAPAATNRLPRVVYVLAAGTFLMGTTEFMVAGLLPEIARDFDTSQARAGLSITVFAVGMVLGAPGVPLLTLRLPPRLALVTALGVYAAAHVVAALTGSFSVLLGARFVAALATGAFWAIAAVVAAEVVGPRRSSGAIGLILGGGMLANVLGVPLGSITGQAVGWRTPMWASPPWRSS